MSIKINYINYLLDWLKTRIIHIGLSVSLLLLVLYLFCSKFRIFLENQKINPSFIIGFFTIIALFLSLIQNSKDKRYSYNLKTIDSIVNWGLKIVGKLLCVKAKSSVMLNSAQSCINAKKEGLIFKDLNNSLSKQDVETEMESIVAGANFYFPEQSENWNNLIDKLNCISKITGNILSNYNENLGLIQQNINFENLALDNADTNLKKAEELNREIENITLTIRNGIVAKINNYNGELKNKYF